MYNIYCGPAPDQLELITTVTSSDLNYTDASAPEGASFYSVKAATSGGSESAFSGVLNFYKRNLAVNAQWQLISHPVTSTDINVASSLNYGFDNVYSSVTTLQENKRYWIKDESGAAYTISGGGNSAASFELSAGWNLVGTLSGTVATVDIDDPSGILTTAPIYNYNGSVYEQSSELIPGQGYWLFAESGGTVNLSISLEPSIAQNNGNTIVAFQTETELEGLGKIYFESGKYFTELTIQGGPLTTDEKYKYLMSPKAP